MKKKTSFAVFTHTETGNEYMVRGNFGSNKAASEEWQRNNVNAKNEAGEYKYPRGLFVKQIVH